MSATTRWVAAAVGLGVIVGGAPAALATGTPPVVTRAALDPSLVAGRGADVQVVGDHFLDNTYNAIMLVSDFPVKDLYSISNVHFKDIRVDGTGTSVVSARTAGGASFANVDARNVGAVGINNCGSFHFTPAGSEFTVTDLGGNDGGGTTGPWLAPWELPNTITCDDRPPVVAPPAPSPW